jgi:hypothetical protein
MPVELSDEFLTTLWKLTKEDPKNFTTEGLYPEWVCTIFRKRPPAPSPKPAREWSGDLEQDINELIEQVKNMAHSLDEIEDVGDKMSYFRVRVALAEKLVALKEKIWNQKNMGIFQKKVLEVFEKVLTQEQKDRFMTQLHGIFK